MKRNRNPMARELLTNKLFRPKQTKTAGERAKQNDRWDRRAKHKSPKPQPGLGDFLSVKREASPAPPPPRTASDWLSCHRLPRLNPSAR